MLPLLVAAALVALATGIGLAWRRADGRARPGSGTTIVAEDVGADPTAFGEAATLLQFSTDTCSRCPGTRRVLAGIAADRPGVRHVEVDLTHRVDLAARLGVLATPTTFVLDGRGRVRTRIVGAARADAVTTALAPLA